MSKTLNTQNPDCMTYESAEIQISVMGGVKLNGLDRLRVTLKVEHCNQAIRHNLDLYNDTQLMKFTRKVAERLEIGTSIIGEVFNELTTELENYRLEQLDQRQQESRQEIKILTEKERIESLDFLKSSNLLSETNRMIGRSGMIGEENNRLIMYLIFTSRKREQPLHIVSLGASGTGKTHLQEKVGELIPEEDKIEITKLSENAFYYFGQQELKNKLILIEDLDGLSGAGAGNDSGAMYALRELQSKKRITKTVAKKDNNGKNRTTTLVVEGPVSVAGCTTKESIYEDNANRSFLIYLDETEAQDENIMNYQRAISAGQINKADERKAAELLRNTQRILEPVKVINPFAEQLKIPKEVFKARRTNNHYLQFIEAVTFYHQYQREQKIDPTTGEIFIETTLEDIEAANQLLKPILLRKSDDLTGACRNYFEKLKLYLINRECHPELVEGFTNKEIREKFRMSGTTLRRYHNELKESGYLTIKSGKPQTGYTYEIVSYEEYKNLQTNINNVLDKQLLELRNNSQSDTDRATKPQVSQEQNGSPKRLKTKKKPLVSQES